MFTLVLLTLALSFAGFAIVALLHRGFVSSVSWIDSRNADKNAHV
jgi:chromate transport protein ChrA